MTTLVDEEILRSALREAAGAMEPVADPAAAVARMIGGAPPGDVEDDNNAGGSPRPPSGRRRLPTWPRRAAGVVAALRGRRRLLVGVAAAVGAVALALALVLSGSGAGHRPTGAEPGGSARTPPVAGTARAAAGTATGPASSGTAHVSAGEPLAGVAPGEAAGAPAPSGTARTPALAAGEVGQPAEIEKTGSATVTTHQPLSAVVVDLTNLVTSEGGFVADSSLQTGTGPSASVTLQVPAANFAAAENGLGGVGRVVALSTRATDVTSQYVNLAAQITALQASEAQYLAIMAKAQSVSDILAVQNQLDQIESQLQQLQSQQQLLQSETTYGTLAVTVVPAGHHRHRPPPPVPVSALDRSWHQAVHGFASGVEGLIRISGPLLFVVLTLAALVLAVRLTLRGLRRRVL